MTIALEITPASWSELFEKIRVSLLIKFAGTADHVIFCTFFITSTWCSRFLRFKNLIIFNFQVLNPLRTNIICVSGVFRVN